ncbi:FixH family protein [Palleronia sp. KMU-117]|uniref:FixH family protein n=1 Tax=Palleronia sp. KMU-117 TaxID=3434108 RepID=UPI003D7478CC
MAIREITGRHVLIGTVSAFSVIIAVNVVMAWQAVSTFPGLEVKNSYVASQSFDADRRAQEALGWSTAASVGGGEVRLSIRDADGRPVKLAALEATVGRATQRKDDQTPDFRYLGGDYVADVVLGPGKWELRYVATAPDGTPFRQRLDLYVR